MKRQFPCILQGSHVWLAFDKENAITLDSEHGKNRGNINFEYDGFDNITAEYLANTYGEVKSKEHAEFIKLLAETNDIPCSHKTIDMNFKVFHVINGCLFFCVKEVDIVGSYKKITIPLPPECESVDEWPKVGGDVLIHDLGFERNTKGTYKGENKNGVPIIELDDGSVFLLGFGGSISKPKTPEQALRDELISAMDDSNTAFQYAEHLAKEIINGEIEGLEYKPQ